MEKTEALQLNEGNFDTKLALSQVSRSDLEWWIDNPDGALKVISYGNPSNIVQSDASQLGLGTSF